MDKKIEDQYVKGAMQAARKEVDAFKKVVRAQEELEFCAVPDKNPHRRDDMYGAKLRLNNDPVLTENHNKLVAERMAAHSALDAKVGEYLAKQGLTVAPPKSQKDDHPGHRLKAEIVDNIESQVVANMNSAFAHGKKPKGCQH